MFDVMNASTTYTKYNSWISMHLLDVESIYTFLWESQKTFFSSIACNSLIASNNQTRQEHNKLATIQREKLKGPHEHSKSL